MPPREEINGETAFLAEYRISRSFSNRLAVNEPVKGLECTFGAVNGEHRAQPAAPHRYKLKTGMVAGIAK
jgi:hypothetical protein